MIENSKNKFQYKFIGEKNFLNSKILNKISELEI